MNLYAVRDPLTKFLRGKPEVDGKTIVCIKQN